MCYFFSSFLVISFGHILVPRPRHITSGSATDAAVWLQQKCINYLLTLLQIEKFRQPFVHKPMESEFTQFVKVCIICEQLRSFHRAYSYMYLYFQVLYGLIGLTIYLHHCFNSLSLQHGIKYMKMNTACSWDLMPHMDFANAGLNHRFTMNLLCEYQPKSFHDPWPLEAFD